MLTKMTNENTHLARIIGILQQSNFNTDWFVKHGLDFILISYI